MLEDELKSSPRPTWSSIWRTSTLGEFQEFCASTPVRPKFLDLGLANPQARETFVGQLTRGVQLTPTYVFVRREHGNVSQVFVDDGGRMTALKAFESDLFGVPAVWFSDRDARMVAGGRVFRSELSPGVLEDLYSVHIPILEVNLVSGRDEALYLDAVTRAGWRPPSVVRSVMEEGAGVGDLLVSPFGYVWVVRRIDVTDQEVRTLVLSNAKGETLRVRQNEIYFWSHTDRM